MDAEALSRVITPVSERIGVEQDLDACPVAAVVEQ
jgi:hypothetical protein